MTVHSGRHFLQIPGPANVPDRVLRAMTAPLIDHRGPEFAGLTREILPGLREVFGTTGPVAIFPSPGTGAWEAALANTLSPGDRVLAFGTGHFAGLWAQVAARIGLDVEVLPGDWRRGPDPDALAQRLEANTGHAMNTGHAIKAVLAVHSETSTGVTARIPAIRAAMDRAGHPALLLADTVSSLGSMEYRHDEWGADVPVGGSQKGLMLPPGLGFNAISPRALAAAAPPGITQRYAPVTAEDTLSNCCGHLITVLGLEICHPEQAERIRQAPHRHAAPPGGRARAHGASHRVALSSRYTRHGADRARGRSHPGSLLGVHPHPGIGAGRPRPVRPGSPGRR